jgi:hypothetical protein
MDKSGSQGSAGGAIWAGWDNGRAMRLAEHDVETNDGCFVPDVSHALSGG